MAMSLRYRCLNCGNRFECEVLSPKEAREAQRRGQPLSRIHCTRCHRTDVVKGW